MAFSLILVFVASVFVFNSANGCTCVRSHHQQQFCESSYVIRGEVLGRNTPVTVPPVLPAGIGSIFYKVKVLDVFKDNTNQISAGDIITLETSANSGVCGVNLENTQYLLGGLNPSAINLCGIVTQWKHVPECQKTLLSSRRYSYDCRCKIEVCEGDRPCQSSMSACKMAFNGEAEQDASCKRIGRWCQWRPCPSQHNIFYSYFGF